MIKMGDRVRVGAHGREGVVATVVLASPNGRSLMLVFPGGLFGVAGGAYVGSMPVLQNDDGTWIEIVNSSTITVEEFEEFPDARP